MTKIRFKDYRMFWITLLMFMVFVGAGTYCYLIENKVSMLGCIMLAIIALFLLLLRYKNILMDDAMIIYEWKFVAMLPTMIDYKDIISVEKKGKHIISIQHKTNSNIYVFDSDRFIQTYQDLKNT